MKITFPNLGNTYIAAKILFDGLGVEYVVPPMNNKECLDIGVAYSPEEMCTPFKIMIGNYIQSINQGADTILLVGSCGPCRFGEYCELQMNILKKLGYNLKFIVLDKPEDIGKKELLNRIKYISSNSSKGKMNNILAAKRALKAINLIDIIEEKAHYLAGYEINKGQCKSILYKYKRDIWKTNNPIEAIRILENYRKKLNKVPIDKNKNPLKIEIIGEIYTIIDPFSNLNIEDKLMDYGVSSRRKLTPSWWLKDAIMSILNLNSIDIRIASKEYLPYYVGGHARECIGEAVLANNANFHGAIQIFPMGCMPQIVSKAILPKISKDKNFPIMTLVVDEMTGEGGYITRIEAFLDLIERRRKNVLYGS
ncbi:2-hydroxyglutaryl-CoA dehydratase [Clostridium botulinum]|uniref:2-hydroxyglutaryl-CoA dehydratase n=1 Tax=Clostridium botulinum TaxID=1491 RepID=UPI0004D6A91A|nr:2-hydroxyglutaryl-CoA dehydratase [Clostridium botulinum]KEI02708.1 2-hydroxyglutaryl-CoA dehydratase [Clostridium botulinum C/D str. BKT75002]KEI11375.1 2-hydroxyglutaryl-CoA dehydratase [Clostridium botulinum C/D str. BKT2873]KGM94689.1 2-hydroxyglutaryl-CoA dehydratase [Clostridium botulinum D str. CCUG 7971]KOC45845.1 2-hydroxyglutaryl-CoA dehydratase [Clostridium botulinum]MCD3352199.1 2-hydroxyglutaryl-CoA dehydratase [Clostridium botulinum D/C]